MRFAALALLCATAWAQPREIFKQLIELNTTESSGNVTRAAEAMAARLRTAGYAAEDMAIVGDDARKKNLVVRLRGSGTARPVLFNAHLDVVEARREDWSFDPFTFTERDGFYYGRGTQDTKNNVAALMDAFIRLKKENFRPGRDLILALTADEEGGGANGVAWLVKNRRDLIDSEFSINADSGGGESRDGKPRMIGVQTSEKLYHTLFFEVKSKGGHSSLPEKENAIYRLAAALTRVAQFDFPVNLNETTRTYFTRMAALETGETAADMKAVVKTPPDLAAAKRLSQLPLYNAFMRTTCVATELTAGHAENALPQTAKASVNCRILPGELPADIEKTIRQVVADPQVSVKPARKAPLSPASPIRKDVFDAIGAVTSELWPGIPVIPIMETGGTDGRILRAAGIPTYGETGMFIDEGDMRAHGKDERIRIKSFDQGVEFMYRLVKLLGR
jgi:acetylornithine deacetylase/succinyl-diaminopimelate desuccinylase-like protein